MLDIFIPGVLMNKHNLEEKKKRIFYIITHSNLMIFAGDFCLLVLFCSSLFSFANSKSRI